MKNKTKLKLPCNDVHSAKPYRGKGVLSGNITRPFASLESHISVADPGGTGAMAPLGLTFSPFAYENMYQT